MRKKIKQLLNKEEGFTLVELLAVLVILGIIVAIAIPAVGNIVGTAQDDANEAEKTMIVDSARLYFMTDENKNKTHVTVEELSTAGYIEERGTSSTNDLPTGYVINEEPFELIEGSYSPNDG